MKPRILWPHREQMDDGWTHSTRVPGNRENRFLQESSRTLGGSPELRCGNDTLEYPLGRGVGRRQLRQNPPDYRGQSGVQPRRPPAGALAGGKPIIYKDPAAFAAAAARALPHAEIEIIPETGHSLHVEKAALVNARMIRFLDSCRL